MMDNAEEVLQLLEEFSKLKPKIIPRELDDYLGYVAKTGNPVYKWSLVKSLFREKMLNVINDFYEDTLNIDLPQCPNVDAFNYDRMKSSLLERLESFHGAPFTVQRICELLTNPRKEYNRADKFMRAIEKNILVVSTREPGRYPDLDSENAQECSINGVQETGDGLDSTYTSNDLGRGPDTSQVTDNLEPIDINLPSNVNRTAPENDQEVSSDSDDNTQENNTPLQEDPILETADSLANELEGKYDENDSSSNVSSTNLSPPSDLTTTEHLPTEMNHCPAESITTTQEIEAPEDSIQKVDSESISLVCTPLDSPSEPLNSNDDVNSCNIPDLPVENKIINCNSEDTNEPESDPVPESENLECNDVKSNELDNVEPPLDVSQVNCESTNNIESVECDTSEVVNSFNNLEAEPSVVNQSSTDSSDNDAPSESVEQVTTCDTTEETQGGVTLDEVPASDEIMHQATIEQPEMMEVDECQNKDDFPSNWQSELFS